MRLANERKSRRDLEERSFREAAALQSLREQEAGHVERQGMARKTSILAIAILQCLRNAHAVLAQFLQVLEFCLASEVLSVRRVLSRGDPGGRSNIGGFETLPFRPGRQGAFRPRPRGPRHLKAFRILQISSMDFLAFRAEL